MATLGHVIVFSLIGGLFSLLGGVFLLRKKQTTKLLADYATPFAAGALLAAVFLDIFKEGMHETDQHDSMIVATLAGILIFFFAERFLRWFHHHHQHGKDDPSIPLVIAGDTIHNAMDGVAIAAAFLISVPTGIVTTIAVAAHEIPQEIGDFGLLLRKGLSKKKVLLVNVMSALATVIMAVLTFQLGDTEKLPIGVLLGLSAGFLLYIAMSDLIPSIHEQMSNNKAVELQPVLLLLGVVVVAFSIQVSHKYIDAEEHHSETQIVAPVEDMGGHHHH